MKNFTGSKWFPGALLMMMRQMLKVSHQLNDGDDSLWPVKTNRTKRNKTVNASGLIIIGSNRALCWNKVSRTHCLAWRSSTQTLSPDYIYPPVVYHLQGWCPRGVCVCVMVRPGCSSSASASEASWWRDSELDHNIRKCVKTAALTLPLEKKSCWFWTSTNKSGISKLQFCGWVEHAVDPVMMPTSSLTSY